MLASRVSVAIAVVAVAVVAVAVVAVVVAVAVVAVARGVNTVHTIDWATGSLQLDVFHGEKGTICHPSAIHLPCCNM